jgi:hypothetical protein
MMALIANIHRDRKKQRRPFKPNDFNPYRDPPPPMTEEQRAAWQARKIAIAESLVANHARR